MRKVWQDKNNVEHGGKVFATKGKHDVIECEICGFKHIIPLFEETQKQEFYSEKFYSIEKENYIDNHQRDKHWWLIEYNEKYDFFEESIKDSSTRKILDIGSGPGFFLKAGKDRGWDVTGVEPGKLAYEYSKHDLRLNVINEFFCRETYKSYGQFNVIHLNNVLEHIINPLDMLEMAKSILLPNGIICVTSPNDFNLLQNIAVECLGKQPWWVVPDHHVNYFNIDSLKTLFSKSGIGILNDATSFPLELFLLMGEDYIENKQSGKQVHTKRMMLEKNFNAVGKNHFKRKIYDSFKNLGLGRAVTIYGYKKQ